MAQTNKFEFQVMQDGDVWNATITRRVSARRTSVSKQKKGFSSEALATEWAKETLAQFLENLQVGNKRKADKRIVRNDLAEKAKTEKEAAAVAYKAKQDAHFAALDAEEVADAEYAEDEE